MGEPSARRPGPCGSELDGLVAELRHLHAPVVARAATPSQYANLYRFAPVELAWAETPLSSANDEGYGTGC